ncbi:glucose-6-phosphate isomerase [Pelagicoccus mobilis]|uniref:Glucose-6-phosphate isomerase n=1 Tax=Pelagicoccus mobilis TaxID=415221 RepID=A0A934VN47_9BACT|nr:glucose-6-phosphate isomerase [Pelagicoccus mobilis]MBK1879546.1 glucose-6-phosphate isomerase [Pelagicoccus mobilis]
MSWDTFKALTFDFPEVSLSLDLSRLGLPEGYVDSQRDAFAKAFAAMDELEGGSIANPDEGRMVGHYWLRNADLAPNDELKNTINSSVAQIKAFAEKVHSGEVKGANGAFTDVLVIGIGGSALGPQFIAHALGVPSEDKAQVHFFDNTDPDGMDLALNAIGDRLGSTLSLVISKSGGTAETRNGMLEAQKAYADMGLDFAKHAVAITGVDSKLDKVAASEGWLERFEMWDWVGGRTSVLCAVGLVAAALQGIDIQALLDGAAAMDKVTRSKEIEKNPAALLALSWFFATNGKGEKDMVILPYKDRLLLFSRYLQQLIMESLGKEFDLEGNVVNQGIAVYGNKGSTDQHAYVQQLREGVPNFFATLIEVLKDRHGPSIDVEPGVTAGDYLQGFLLGTREALSEKDRQSITITVAEINEGSVANLIALYERAVGYYATLTGINAYHQPGVEAGKKAAGSAIDLGKAIVETLEANKGESFDAPALAEKLGKPESTELVYKIALHMAANAKAGISKIDGAAWHEAKFLVLA